MLPDSSVDDVQDTAFRHAKFSRKLVQTCSAFGVCGAYPNHRLIIEFGLVMIFTSVVIASCSSFCRTVLHVIAARAEKKMIGIDARRVVAGVAYAKNFIKLAFVHHVGKAMSADDLAFSRSGLNHSISAPRLRAGPQPA